MPYPWANVILLFLLVAELATGLFGLVSGSSDRAIYLHLHRILGFSILAVFLWKSRNIFRSLSRIRRLRAGKTTSTPIPYGSLAIVLLLALSVGLALVWSHAGPFKFQNFSGVSWHIYVSVPLAPLLLMHAFSKRWTLRPAFWAQRRNFLRTGGLALAGLALWQLVEFTAVGLKLPGSQRRFTGSYAAASFSGNSFPSTSWINDDPDPINPSNWTLQVTGHVERELTLAYNEIAALDTQMTATLDCTGGWHSTQRWTGIPLRQVLDQAGLKPEAASATVRSVTGYTRRFSIDESEELLLATTVGDETLSHRHGFPLRLVAPGRRGYQWVKWVVALEVNDTGKWLQSPLPLQ